MDVAGEPDAPSRSVASASFIALIRIYQRVSRRAPGVCRYAPTCSAYAIEAIERYGAVRGAGMAVWRICRCNPFSRGGHDPVR